MQAPKTITRRKPKVNRLAPAGPPDRKRKPSATLDGILTLLQAARTAMAGLLKNPLCFDLRIGPCDLATEKPLLDALFLVYRASNMLAGIEDKRLDVPAKDRRWPPAPKYERHLARLLDLASAGYGAAA
jgi:hypothetical protein